MPERDPHLIGARIARRRHQLDWSQVELAGRLGVSPSTVANWERGASYPAKKWGKVEQVLGITLDGEPEAEPEAPTPEDIDNLRAHIREVLGEGSDLEAAMDDVVARKPAPGPRAGGASGRSASRRDVRWSG